MVDRIKYKIRNPDHIIEELILFGMITQTEFLQRIIFRLNLDFFKSSEVRTIIQWVLNYYENHNKAPGLEIDTICQIEVRHDKRLQREKLENLLETIFAQQADTFNMDYIMEKALAFFKRRSLTISIENTQHFLDKDDLEKAELAYYNYQEVVQEIQQNPNPLGNEALEHWWEHMDKELIRFPGYLGEYLKPICRKQLIGVLGPPKRGKTTALTEFACIGLMHKLKVIYFSLEMSLDKINQRIVTRLVGRPKITKPFQDFRIPVMDCVHNQTGKCRLSYRKGTIDLIGDDGEIMEYCPEFDGRYIPCSECLKERDNYKFAPWYITKRFSKTPLKYFKDALKDFKNIFGDNLKVEAYPTGKFSYQNLENRLTLMEQEEGFLPDICIPEGSLVLTQNRGLVPIEKIKKNDKIWDGRSWISHKGIIYKGIKEIIEYAGIKATPNHLFWTNNGWRSLESCKQLELHIIQTENNGKNLRIDENYIPNNENAHKKKKQKWAKAIQPVCLRRMHQLWEKKMANIWPCETKIIERLSCLLAAKKISYVALSSCTRNGSKMHKSETCSLETLWPKGYQIQLSKHIRSLFMDIKKFGIAKKQKTRTGSNRKRWSLRTRKSEMVYKKTELPTHNSTYDNSKNLSIQAIISSCKIFGRNIKNIFENNVHKRNSNQMEQVPKQKSRVWDIKNAGPFHCFTVQGVLAHNCVVDAADNIKKQDRDRRIEIGRIWEQLTALSQERNCLVVTASQTNREATNKANLTIKDLAEDFSKAMTADALLAINQTPSEKEQQIFRVSTILHRHKEFSVYRQCRVLQAPKIGQFNLGSCPIYKKSSR